MRWHTVTQGGEVKGKLANGVGSQLPFTLPRNMVYPALLPLMLTPRLPVVDWIDATADLNELVRFAERRNLFSARVPSYLKRSLHIMSVFAALEGKWRGNQRMEWVTSTNHTTSEHGVSSITTANAHISVASSRLNWRPRWFKWKRPFRAKDEICFLRVCHHISNAVYILWVCLRP